MEKLIKLRLHLVKLLVVFVLMMPTIGIAQNLLSGPQKVVQDNNKNRLLISNYYTGDIIQIDSLGSQSFYVKSANFIDGLEIYGENVYGIGHNRQVRSYNLETGKLTFEILIPGENGNYLSSIVADSLGHLFISCPKLNIIYKMRISDQSYWIFAEGNRLNGPNGILLEKESNRILVINEVLDSSSPPTIVAIDLADSTTTTLATIDLNRPDGLVRDKNGYYYVGGYYLPGMYRINPDFNNSPELLFEGSHMVYPTYSMKSHSLLYTNFDDNDWGEFFINKLNIAD